jgi:dTDP-glucose 4,6-dehydratase
MRTDDGRALPTFIGQALQGEPVTVFGDGTQTRSFCYVDDLVDGLVRLVRFLEEGSARDGPVVLNLGNPEEITVLQLAREIIDMTGSRSEIVFRPLPTDDPRVRCPDITRAVRLLGWRPRVSRREGLERTIADFRHRLAPSPAVSPLPLWGRGLG